MTGPGSRVLIGRIALNRCVPTVAPASIAARVCSYVASVWPTAATTPGVDDLPDRRNGAVAFRRDGDHADGPAARFENAVDLGGIRIPHQRRLVGAAPLRGQPRTFQVDPVDQAGANVVRQFAATWRSRSSGPAVTREATSVVVPCLR